MMVSKMICLRSGLFLPLLLGSMAFGGWLLSDVGLSPRPAIAQTTVNMDLLLEPSAEESFAVFIARSEANAAVRVQSLFDQDLLRTEVRLTVLGQHGLAIAPVLKLRVTRQEWTNYPDPEIWSIYYPETRSLLSFDDFEEDTSESSSDGDQNRGNNFDMIPPSLDSIDQNLPTMENPTISPTVDNPALDAPTEEVQ